MNRFLVGVFAAVALSIVPLCCFGKDDKITVKGEMKTFTSQKQGLRDDAKKESNFSDRDLDNRKDSVDRTMIGKAQDVEGGQKAGKVWVGEVSSEISGEMGGDASDSSLGGMLMGPGIVKPAILPNLNSPEEIAKRAAEVIRAAIPELSEKIEHIGNVTRKVQETFPEGSDVGQRRSESNGLDKLEEYLDTLTNNVNNATGNAVAKFVDELPQCPSEDDYKSAEEVQDDEDLSAEAKAAKEEQEEADRIRQEEKEKGNPDWESAWKDADGNTRTSLEREHDAEEADKDREQKEADRKRQEEKEKGNPDWENAWHDADGNTRTRREMENAFNDEGEELDSTGIGRARDEFNGGNDETEQVTDSFGRDESWWRMNRAVETYLNDRGYGKKSK